MECGEIMLLKNIICSVNYDKPYKNCDAVCLFVVCLFLVIFYDDSHYKCVNHNNAASKNVQCVRYVVRQACI